MGAHVGLSCRRRQGLHPGTPTDQSNERRGETAAAACIAFAVASDGPTNGVEMWHVEPETVTVDLLANIQHMCDQRGLDYEELRERAEWHYHVETGTADEAAAVFVAPPGFRRSPPPPPTNA